MTDGEMLYLAEAKRPWVSAGATEATVDEVAAEITQSLSAIAPAPSSGPAPVPTASALSKAIAILAALALDRRATDRATDRRTAPGTNSPSLGTDE